MSNLNSSLIMEAQIEDPRIQTYPESYDSSIPENISFPEFVLKRIISWKDNEACVDAETKETLTFTQIRQSSYALAAGFQIRLNLQHGDNVAVVLPNCVDYPVVIFAVTLCGASATLINPVQTISELEHSIRLTNPKIWVGTADFAAKYDKVYDGRSDKPPFVLLSNDSSGDRLTLSLLKAIGNSEQSFQRPAIVPREDAALILFSSGTTGVPKGVILTHTNLMAARRQSDELGKNIRRKNPMPAGTMPVNECLGAILPFFHSFGISGVFDNLMGGFRYVIIPNFTLRRFLQAVQDHKISIVSLVPAIAVQLAKQPVEKLYDLSSLKVIRCGASALSAETIDVLQRKLKCIVFQGYGMTEATVRSHANFKGANREGSIGIVMPFCECKVVDRDTNEILGPHQEGEICVRGPIVMKGYIGDAEATGVTIDPEGWLRTGDIGYYDKDGFFFITDRMKELIKYKGFQVSPAEIEKILLTHPDVLDAAVAPLVDRSAGEVPRAYVVKRPGTSVTGEELVLFVADKVSSYKRLRGGVVFIDAIPKTSTGKIVRRALKDKVASKL